MAEEERLTLENPYVLFVEGSDEVNFFKALLKALGLQKIQIINGGGVSKMKARIKAFKTIPGYDEDLIKAIGIVGDADGNRRGIFDGICNVLQQGGLPIPKEIFVPTVTMPQVSILIMPPNNEGTGRMLEDLCLASMIDDAAMGCVDKYIECLQVQGFTIADNKLAKARTHAFLASRPEPDKVLGLAAQSGYWNWDSPVFDTVKDFLRQLAQV